MTELQQTRLEIDRITDVERAWIEPYMGEDWWQANHEEGFRGFDMRYDVNGQLVITADHVDVDNLCGWLRLFLKTHRPKSHIVLEYCWHGEDYVGGAAALITARKIAHFNPHDMASQWHKTGDCAPKVEDHATGLDKMEDSINENGSDQGQ